MEELSARIIAGSRGQWASGTLIPAHADDIAVVIDGVPGKDKYRDPSMRSG
jgi:hypothetical protein